MPRDPPGILVIISAYGALAVRFCHNWLLASRFSGVLGRGMGVEFLLSFLGRVYKRWGGRGLVLFAAGAVAGAFVALSTFGTYVYQFAIWRADEHLASANKRADRAEETSAAANKRASGAETALREQKANNDTLNTRLQTYEKAEETRKKNAALPKQTAKRPKSQILTDLFGEEDWFIIGHNRRKLVDRRYIIVATYSDLMCGGALGGPCGCTLT